MTQSQATASYHEQLNALQHGSTVSLPDDLGVLRVQGADAANFLHNQLSNAVLDMPANTARLGGYCSVKGRLQASMVYWGSNEDVTLLLSKDLLAALQKRLTMFVLRAKAKLSDASAETVQIGLTGAAVAQAVQAYFPALPAEPMMLVHSAEHGTLLRMADVGGQPRYLWCAPFAVADAALASLPSMLTVISTEAWRWAEVQSAVPRIVQATQEQFVPQMINFEALGGVNFKKGCYPGQEIVARSQYRGTIKRRMQLAHIETDLSASAPAVEIYHSSDAAQPCGMIVLSAAANTGVDALVECKLEALESGSLHLGSATGPVLTLKTLPYALPTEQ